MLTVRPNVAVETNREGGNIMNTSNFEGSRDYLYDRILELTSKGLSTREAKRKISRDDRKKFNRIKAK